MGRLTDKFIRAIKATGKDQFINDGQGLYLRVTPIGSRLWAYRFRNAQRKTRWLDIGTYPSTSLAEARAQAAQLKLKRRDGIDPAEERQRQREADDAQRTEEAQRLAEIASRMTINDLFDRWMSLEINKRVDGGAEIRRMFAKDVLPEIGTMAVEDVRKRHIATIVDNVLSRGTNGRMASPTSR